LLRFVFIHPAISRILFCCRFITWKPDFNLNRSRHVPIFWNDV